MVTLRIFIVEDRGHGNHANDFNPEVAVPETPMNRYYDRYECGPVARRKARADPRDVTAVSGVDSLF